MNLPNALTLFRMALIPVFVWLYYAQQPLWAMLVFLLASFTDFLDGYLARRLHQVTSFGKLMDPLADKLMTVSMLLCLADTNKLPMWVPFAMICKEILMVAGSAFLLGKHKIVVMAQWPGKVATVAFIVAVTMVFPWHPYVWLTELGRALIYAAVALSFLAALQYALNYLRRSAQ